ncbi:hypothetical protein CLI91_04450 [Lentilactobacillus hilgardii]|uniref:Uncharacterized protein n=1 Tax=Lentilactobacillus hilgardii (strain ATCC 8290 / DSM 20176 / CCUG 30140 / JCM 1155 / KCTC 3500 / NBRC 15886 / NCIMB 8040 / NRRL B-1843 / 9) TaxID=1423757 RepID=C0XKY7_LENH9|nr:hypothetical protein HMPREF0497_2096 [Lentilactobacillus buchneri ATCC 11577]EEI23957.1 hypothetical protein HMPREF0519_1898 [Lentilactobacillus hilgardii DSM 20176 = ATCC 8290]EEI70490.1 hypothetical protein HMPREF0496_2207 [Lentilactobacillus hilgardii ATCC 27305]MBZ2200611.1 hypothetical protein [Lentilactobacillus hilgardii]RRG08021.1 MAG: hypothetical protein DUD35_12345 [Lactobacillus sp.]
MIILYRKLLLTNQQLSDYNYKMTFLFIAFSNVNLMIVINLHPVFNNVNTVFLFLKFIWIFA